MNVKQCRSRSLWVVSSGSMLFEKKTIIMAVAVKEIMGVELGLLKNSDYDALDLHSVEMYFADDWTATHLLYHFHHLEHMSNTCKRHTLHKWIHLKDFMPWCVDSWLCRIICPVFGAASKLSFRQYYKLNTELSVVDTSWQDLTDRLFIKQVSQQSLSALHILLQCIYNN